MATMNPILPGKISFFSKFQIGFPFYQKTSKLSEKSLFSDFAAQKVAKTTTQRLQISLIHKLTSCQLNMDLNKPNKTLAGLKPGAIRKRRDFFWSFSAETSNKHSPNRSNFLYKKCIAWSNSHGLSIR